MNNEKEEQSNRLTNKDKSNKAKLAWRKYHGHYVSGIKKRERNAMTTSFIKTCQELDECVTEALNEAEVTRDNVFENKLDISLDSIAGGISLQINKENGNVSISTSLEQTGSGMYKLTDWDDATLKTLYSSLKEDLLNLCKNFDEEINQLIAKNGLKSTK